MISDRKAVLLLLAGICVSAAAAGCLDVTPIAVAASTNASSQSRECAVCYTNPDDAGPGCGDEVTACFADPKCKKAFQCSVDRGCFQGAREQLITCGMACASEAGFTSLNDNAYALATNVYGCLLGACKDACFGASGGGPDAGVDVAEEAAAMCGAPNAQNNELGYGGYCLTIGDCSSDAGLRLCAASFGGGNFCTGPCTVDDECGTGAYCAHTAQGSGCVPLACRMPPEAGAASDGTAD